MEYFSDPYKPDMAKLIILLKLIEEGFQTGTLSKEQTKDYYVQHFAFQRLEMIENFTKANDPMAILERFAKSSNMYIQNGMQERDQMHVINKPFRKYQFKIQDEELLKYRPIQVKDLKIEEVHYGSYIELKIDGKPAFLKSFHTVCVDANLIPINLDAQLQHMVRCSFEKMDHKYDIRHFQEGQKFVVLNPYFRFGAECHPFIKVDDSEQLIFLDQNDKFEQYIKRAQLKSQGYINTQQYEKAVIDSNKCLEIDPESMKNLFRKAKALSQLGQEQESLQILSNLNPTLHNEEILSFINDVQERIQQQKGIFDFGKLLKQSKLCQLKQDLKIQDYFGPLQLKLNKEQRRGIFASQDIKKGQLILAEMPIYHNEIKSITDLQFFIMQNFIYLESPDHVPLIRNAQQSMLNKMEEARWLKYLDIGHNQQQLFDLKRLIKKDRIDNDFEQIGYHQVNKIMQLTKRDCIQVDIQFGQKLEKDFYPLNCVWPVFSLINHSCDRNVQNFQIGLNNFVVATKDIKEGEEILVSLTPRYIPTEEKLACCFGKNHPLYIEIQKFFKGLFLELFRNDDKFFEQIFTSQ
ncbi:UNKNOWN [Stylonychia lemnae]|uniref:SET domain-containing protein n=1 Tax=Stylonychia lemnae TaxID=5949 RepID=A0A078APT1_STYLE|nr:UNKNOWN [Stylonychia lemnae]|eukprot:CDW83307.1 UNKNOWN [Stylonychia lemnae]